MHSRISGISLSSDANQNWTNLAVRTKTPCISEPKKLETAAQNMSQKNSMEKENQNQNLFLYESQKIETELPQRKWSRE